MAYKGEKDKNQYVAFFEENQIGTYEFIAVAQCTDSNPDSIYYGEFVINAGPNRGFEISKECVIDVDNILEDLKKTKKQEKCLPSRITSYGKKPRYIAMILGEDTKREVYKKLKKSIGGRPNNAQTAEEFAMNAYKIGQCIEEISLYLGEYSITFNEDLTLDTAPGIDRDKLIRNVFKDKTDKQEATATERKTRNNTIPNNNVTQTTTTNVTKPSMAEKKKGQSVKLDANQIIERMKKKIKGQDKALEDIVSALVLNQEIIGSDIENADQWKTNILIDGPSGSGKTYIIESTAEELGLPCCVTGITNYSGTGYKGASLNDILARLLKAADGDLELAQKGIVALDEFDKLSNNEQDSGNSNAMHQSVQDELLTYMSGTKIEVEYNGMIYDFDTTNLSFIAMGAFEKMHKRKIEINEAKIKSNDTADGISREYEVTKDDYIAEGLRRELLGRFQTLIHTNELGIEELKDILLNSTNSRLKKIELIEKLRHKTIKITDDAIDYIAQDAFKNNTGARALGDSIENIISFLNRDINDSSVTEIIITPEIVKKASEIQKIKYIDPNSRKKMEGR